MSCSNCRAKTAKILDLSDAGSSSSAEVNVKDDTLGFEVSGEHYHDYECSVYRTMNKGNMDKKTVFKLCAKEERIMAWARTRVSDREIKSD